jgi:hypothetical protein
VKGRLQGKFLDHYYDDLYEWLDFHECRDCLGATDYIGCSLCKRDLTSNQIVLPNGAWILCWTAGNNIKEQIDDYYRQNPVHTTISTTIPLVPTTGIKDVLPHMSQNLLEVVENIHTAISADPDNTNNDEAVIQVLQQAQRALDQQMKKWVWFDGVEMPARKGKAPESILKHPDHAGAVRETHNSAASPTTPLRTTATAPAVTSPTIKNTTASNTSGPQYRYSTTRNSPQCNEFPPGQQRLVN